MMKRIKEENGEFSVKALAGTIAVIIIIGLVVMLLRDGLLLEIITFFWEKAQDMVDTMING